VTFESGLVSHDAKTGTEAVRNAAYAVASGVYDLVLAVGYEKIKDLRDAFAG
jgi:acetyl-CoA C-acetyltransferase